MFNFIKSLTGAADDDGTDFMPWLDDYKLGIKIIDDDHINLFNTE